MTKTEMRMACKALKNYGKVCTKDYIYTASPFFDPEIKEYMIVVQKWPIWCDGDYSLVHQYMKKYIISYSDLIKAQ